MKNTILFFTAGIVASAAEKIAAVALAEKTGLRVVYRNGSAIGKAEEKVEACSGAAGMVEFIPSAYITNGTDVYVLELDEDGALQVELHEGEPDEEDLNEIGLPNGCPNNRSDLRSALDEEGVVYHRNAKTTTLVEIFREQVLNKPEEHEEDEEDEEDEDGNEEEDSESEESTETESE